MTITVRIGLCQKVSITFSKGWLVWFDIHLLIPRMYKLSFSHTKFGYIFLVFSTKKWQRKGKGLGQPFYSPVDTTMEERCWFFTLWVFFCFLDFEILHVSSLTRSYSLGKVWKSWWRNIGRENEVILYNFLSGTNHSNRLIMNANAKPATAIFLSFFYELST